MELVNEKFQMAKTMSSDATEKLSNQLTQMLATAQEQVSVKVEQGRDVVAELQKTVAGYQKTISEHEYTQKAMEIGNDIQKSPVCYMKRKASEAYETALPALETAMPQELIQEGTTLVERIQELQKKVLDTGISTITIEETKGLFYQIIATLLT